MHVPVMLLETAEMLAVAQGGCYIDATVGSAGHASEILRRAGPEGRLLGIDRDIEALERARVRLRDVPGSVCLVHGAHGDLRRLAEANGFGAVDAILMDLGVSSEQIDTAAAGFSFRRGLDGPLDCRMDRTQGETAAELIARLGERELAEMLRRLGEEPQARRIARAIVRERERGPIATTGRLADVVDAAMGRRGEPRHPAVRRVYQAVRMAVNTELEDLARALEDGMRLLRPGGRFAVLTYESLTDRMVKQRFAAHVGKLRALQQGGEAWEGELPAAVAVTRKAMVAGGEEIERNPRARSAKLRVVARKD
ncbi:MAG: 16S rRNA (cytosine(1402)-N(4))-methyltransferase RsmH [Kiritimatiellaeota bacterium]|nr:16S rRNA (cytosine(1402)-N(4))-methyltransferase RsmH [Kiritimatiellota bacterium]